MSDKPTKEASQRPIAKQFAGSVGWLLAVSAVYIAWLAWLFYVGWMHTVK